MHNSFFQDEELEVENGDRRKRVKTRKHQVVERADIPRTVLGPLTAAANTQHGNTIQPRITQDDRDLLDFQDAPRALNAHELVAIRDGGSVCELQSVLWNSSFIDAYLSSPPRLS